MAFFWDFPIPPESHPDNGIKRSYILGGRQTMVPQLTEGQKH
jgi:hypothetical protein